MQRDRLYKQKSFALEVTNGIKHAHRDLKMIGTQTTPHKLSNASHDFCENILSKQILLFII